jgi:hypothetical protein
MSDHIPTETLAETENYSAWISQEPDGETTYHIEVGNVTLHFFDEEWDEFLELIESLAKKKESGSKK